jgi:hypothetical protein
MHLDTSHSSLCTCRTRRAEALSPCYRHVVWRIALTQVHRFNSAQLEAVVLILEALRRVFFNSAFYISPTLARVQFHLSFYIVELFLSYNNSRRYAYYGL